MKKVLSIAFIACMMLFMVGCGTEYPDTNGPDDYTLETITDENIINRDIGAAGLTYEETNMGGLHSAEYSAKNLNGTEQIYLTSFWGKSDVIVYIGHMNVESGNFRLVIINNDEIIYDIPLDAFAEEFRFDDLEGDFSISVAGESACFDFSIEVR